MTNCFKTPSTDGAGMLEGGRGKGIFVQWQITNLWGSHITIQNCSCLLSFLSGGKHKFGWKLPPCPLWLRARMADWGRGHAISCLWMRQHDIVLKKLVRCKNLCTFHECLSHFPLQISCSGLLHTTTKKIQDLLGQLHY